ncbi:MAG: helix-turn-helix domain-containing protein [Sarcina sp.]
MISYKPLMKMLIDRDMKKSDLKQALRLHSSTMSKLSKNEYISLKVIEEICIYLNCSINEVVEVIPNIQE